MEAILYSDVARPDEVTARLDDTWFAWAGGTSDTDVFYYRIHSPVVLIEFDHQRPVGTRAIGGARTHWSPGAYQR